MAEVTKPIITDTTGQSIASAISGLGQTLGSDRALIDGSNIANPAAFRNAIGAVNSANIINTYKSATVAYSSGWVNDFFDIDMSITDATRAFFIAYNSNTTTFGFLQKRKSDGKIMSTITWSVNDSIFISGVL